MKVDSAILWARVRHGENGWRGWFCLIHGVQLASGQRLLLVDPSSLQDQVMTCLCIQFSLRNSYVTNHVTYYFLFSTSKDPPVYTFFTILNKLTSLVVLRFSSLIHSHAVKVLYISILVVGSQSVFLLWIMNKCIWNDPL